jgi:hypothetical protein
MSAKFLVFDADRTAYGIDQIERPMTVGELREFLKDFDEDDAIILSHDRGYTYGTLSRTVSIRVESKGEYGVEYEEIDESWVWC